MQHQGTRLPEDWYPQEDDFQWALNERPDLNLDEIKKATANFIDYWLDLPGKAAKKISWTRTWKNHIRNTRGFYYLKKQVNNSQGDIVI